MKLIAILILVAFMGMAGAAWYPETPSARTVASDVGGVSNPLGLVTVQTISAAESSDDDQIFNTTAGALNQTTNLLINSTSGWFLAQPDVPRNIIATWNASTSGSVKLTGTDINNAAITENLSVSSGTTAASTKAFKTVTRIDADLTTGQTAKTLKLGTGNLLGLNNKLARNTVLLEYVNGVRETAAGTVTTNSTVLSLNTIDTYTAPGGYVTVVYYVV
jgi:hypothetical protein